MSSVIKKRKQRKVNGGFIRTDDVTVNSGHNFKNWIQPAVQKIKQRETMILGTKVAKIVSICDQVSTFY